MAALESLSKEIATLQAALLSLRDGPMNDKLDKVSEIEYSLFILLSLSVWRL